MNIYLSSLINSALTLVLSLVNTISFILGFIAVPAWLLYVLTDQPRGKQALGQLVPAWLRADFWAVLGIVDRAFGRFIRGQVVTGLVTSGLVYLGLKLLVYFYGIESTGRYEVLLAMIAGLAQLIPSIGPFLGVIPAMLVGLSISVQFSLMILALYIVIQWFIINFVYARVERDVIDAHPAILILILVALSQFGFWWILLATPLTAVVRDLFRYAYGRFAEPPRPAGLLPGEPLPARTSIQSANATSGRRLSLYRHQRNLDQSNPRSNP